MAGVLLSAHRCGCGCREEVEFANSEVVDKKRTEKKATAALCWTKNEEQ